MRNRRPETGNWSTWASSVTFSLPVSCFLSPVSPSSEKIDTRGKEGDRRLLFLNQSGFFVPPYQGGTTGGSNRLWHSRRLRQIKLMQDELTTCLPSGHA